MDNFRNVDKFNILINHIFLCKCGIKSIALQYTHTHTRTHDIYVYTQWLYHHYIGDVMVVVGMGFFPRTFLARRFVLKWFIQTSQKLYNVLRYKTMVEREDWGRLGLDRRYTFFLLLLLVCCLCVVVWWLCMECFFFFWKTCVTVIDMVFLLSRNFFFPFSSLILSSNIHFFFSR